MCRPPGLRRPTQTTPNIDRDARLVRAVDETHFVCLRLGIFWSVCVPEKCEGVWLTWVPWRGVRDGREGAWRVSGRPSRRGGWARVADGRGSVGKGGRARKKVGHCRENIPVVRCAQIRGTRFVCRVPITLSIPHRISFAERPPSIPFAPEPRLVCSIKFHVQSEFSEPQK